MGLQTLSDLPAPRASVEVFRFDAQTPPWCVGLVHDSIDHYNNLLVQSSTNLFLPYWVRYQNSRHPERDDDIALSNWPKMHTPLRCERGPEILMKRQ